MFVLFCDFGLPYTGQMHLKLACEAPGVSVVDLFNDAPSFDPQASAYLLPAYRDEFPVGCVVLCIVDPGVGGARTPVCVKADGRWYVGPDNGLFSQVIRRAKDVQAYRIDWRPEAPLSASFHGRDLFSPLAARLYRGDLEGLTEIDSSTLDRADWPDDLAAVIYIDDFGNAITGLRRHATQRIVIDNALIPMAETFSQVETGTAFAYINSNGLIEIAVNQGSAAENLGLSVGCQLNVTKE